jgi:hypothetical protein
MLRTALENLVGYFAGEPRHVVGEATSAGGQAIRR